MVAPLTEAEIDAADFDDLGVIELPDEPPLPGDSTVPAGDGGDGGGGESYPVPDEPPAHARKQRRGKGKTAEPARKVRVTAGIRADITAKISMPLEISGQIWAARDPLCGGTFLAQRPAIADALADIVCDSADLVAFFTGPGGQFMRYLNLGAALWPVIEITAAHHVYHSVQIAPDGADSNADSMRPQYAA